MFEEGGGNAGESGSSGVQTERRWRLLAASSATVSSSKFFWSSSQRISNVSTWPVKLQIKFKKLPNSLHDFVNQICINKPCNR